MDDEVRGFFAFFMALTIYGGAMWLFIQWLGRRLEKERAEKRKARESVFSDQESKGES